MTTRRAFPRRTTSLLPGVVLLGLPAVLGACADTTGTGPADETPAPSSVSVTPSSAALDAIGATVRFTAVVRDQRGREMTGVAVSWSALDTSIASIDDAGLATAAGEGTTTIVAKASPSVFGYGDVTVTPRPIEIKTTSLPTGVVSLPYDATLDWGGAGSPSWSVSSGVLPPGLQLDAGTGEIGGIPEAAGMFAFTLTLAEGTREASRDYAIAVASDEFGLELSDDQFALIQPGSFVMGNDQGSTNEQPTHTVNLTSAFEMQRTEVTQRQWKAVMGSNPSTFAECGEVCPVDGVSWNDVQTFITALNQRDPGKNYRLPTEAEWEYSARAGTTGDYGGTGVLDEMGWYEENGGSRTHFVALKTPNAWGLYDMHGNAIEWVQDWYAADYYSVSPTDDPPGPDSGDRRVFRGGAADRPAVSARSATRTPAVPNLSGYSCSGFRLARDPQ